VTPLNFVCKCRAAPPPRQRPTVSGEISIEQTFGRAQSCAFFCSCDRNTDELWVLSRGVVCSFVARVLEEDRHRHAFAVARACAGTDSPSQNFFTANRPKRRSGRRWRAQNARIGARRFAPAARAEAVRALAWHPRRGDFRRRSRPRAPRATEFSHARTPEAAALRFRDVA
jgi:hypothetical protein